MPIIIGGLVGLLVIFGGLYMLLFSGGGGDEVTVPPSETAGVPGVAVPAVSPGGMPPGAMPGTSPAMPGASPATPGAETQTPGAVAAATSSDAKEPPLEEYRSDPFRPVFGPKPRKSKFLFTSRIQKPNIVKVRPVVLDQAQVEQEILPEQPQRRMAGILKNGTVYAIIVTDGGKSSIVRPGEPLDENVAVDRILPDRVILRSTKLKKPQYIEVLKSAGNPPPRATAAGTGTGGPTETPLSGRRGRGGGRGPTGGGMPPLPMP